MERGRRGDEGGKGQEGMKNLIPKDFVSEGAGVGFDDSQEHT